MQPDPGAVRLGNLTECLNQFQHAGFDRLAIKKAGAVFHVNTVGRGVLADDQQLFDAAFKKRTGFNQYITNGTRHQIAAHRRNDAKRAAVVAAFTDFQIRIVARRELDARHTK